MTEERVQRRRNRWFWIGVTAWFLVLVAIAGGIAWWQQQTYQALPLTSGFDPKPPFGLGGLTRRERIEFLS